MGLNEQIARDGFVTTTVESLVTWAQKNADLMIVAGTVTYKMAWVVKKVWDQMPDPKWCIAMGVCTSTGGMFRSYPVVQGIDQFLPVDAYVSGCPPRPEALMKALMYIQEKVDRSKPQLINLGKDTGDVRRSDLIVTP
jgi:NADH-quinone oxidoreductase subunit B